MTIADYFNLLLLSLQVIRRGGLRWPLLYNLLGGKWEPIMMDARIGMGAGGALSGMSLLELHEPQLQSGGPHGHEVHPVKQ